MTSELHRRVLIVDDDRSVREILATALRQKALVADEAEDGRQAIDLLRQNSYAVVLLDILMPGVNGFGVLEAIGASSVNEPVVLVVTGADRSVIEKLDASRIHGVVRKPFDPQDIAAIVAACADLRGRGGFETMALATVLSSAPLFALLKL
jgi:two-component system, OmpR family, response regulator ResD